MPLTVAIDARPLADPLGEAFAYTLNLVHALAYVDQETRFHLFCDRDPDPAVVPVADNVRAARLDAGRALWKAVALPSAARAVGADLIHVQGLLPAAPGMPVVTTIRHLGPWRTPERYGRVVAWRWRWLLPRQLARAAAVIVPWRHFREELLARVRLPADRVAAIPYGVEPLYRPQCESVVRYAVARLALPERYVFARVPPAGDAGDAVAVWQAARTQGLTAPLVLERDDGTSGLPSVGGVEVKAMPAVLSGAVACLLGEAGESASLALLENLACGTPTVGPSDPILAEIGGEAVCLGDQAEQAAALARLAADEGERARRAEAGLARVQSLTWPAMAERTLEVCRGVL